VNRIVGDSNRPLFWQCAAVFGIQTKKYFAVFGYSATKAGYRWKMLIFPEERGFGVTHGSLAQKTFEKLL